MPTTPTTTTQTDLAIRLYESRSPDYDSSWHPTFTKRFVSHLSLSPGQRVLDLACGTGLLTFLLADAVGASGRVIGVDITPGMLAKARAKMASAFVQSNDATTTKITTTKYANVEFYEGDIMHLEGIEGVEEGSFDVVTIASALVLFPDPKVAVGYWARFLKPGGVLAVDSTHPRNLVFGTLIERTGRRMGLEIPYYKEWSVDEGALGAVLEGAGLEVLEVVTVGEQAGYGRRYYDKEEGDEVFERNIGVGHAKELFGDEEVRRKAKVIFREEWEKVVVDGRVEEVDAVFLGIGRKPVADADADKGTVFSGGCRCRKVEYIATAPPTNLTWCHCRACRQLSGSAFLPFVQVPRSAFKVTTSSTSYQTLKLSDIAERTFCSGCGSPITMIYKSEPDLTYIAMGSVDEETFQGEWPRVNRHIFLKERALWMQLPDDEAKHYDGFPKEDADG